MSALLNAVATVTFAYLLLCSFGVVALGVGALFTRYDVDLEPRKNPIDAFWAFFLLLGMLIFLQFTMPLLNGGTKAVRGIQRRLGHCRVSG